MTGLRERKKTETRQHLVYAAIRLFAERGFDGVTVEDISAEANVSPSTFFRYFDSKAGAVFGLARQRIADLSAALEARPANVSVLEVTHDFWLSQVDGIVTDPDVFHAQQELADGHAQIAGERSRVFDSGREIVAKALRAESPERPVIELEMLASVTVSAVFTGLRLWHEAGGDLAEIFEDCWRLVDRPTADPKGTA
ncbi:MAG TPA: TetR family transcriptional regulator [Gaiellaceae bacterium]|nr:TetR family transcriptional regulator [Gaiellaceae bacterium]